MNRKSITQAFIFKRLAAMFIFNAALLITTVSNAGEENHQHHSNKQHGSVVGAPALSSESDKTISVTMLDSMKYVFDKQLDIYDGDVIRFVVTNKGEMTHEFSIGDAEEQQKHAAMMQKNPNMIHSDGNTLSLKSGESGEIVWRFKSGREIVFSCNVPGHFEAGMFERHSISPLSRTKILTEQEMHKAHDHESHKH